jgi:tetratricopeptide (TPR) repeat protein
MRWFLRGIEVDPEYSANYTGVAEVFRLQGQYDIATEWFKQAIRLDPSERTNYLGLVEVVNGTRMYGDITDFLSKTADNSLARSYIELFRKAGAKKEIANWLKSDTKEIIDVCRSRKIPIIMQSYPDVQAHKEVSEALREVAQKKGVPFVDQDRLFAEMWKRGEKREGYYVADGHCNAKGYGVMARNIYEEIVRGGFLKDE